MMVAIKGYLLTVNAWHGVARQLIGLAPAQVQPVAVAVAVPHPVSLHR